MANYRKRTRRLPKQKPGRRMHTSPPPHLWSYLCGPTILILSAYALLVVSEPAAAQNHEDNLPPRISIVYPYHNDVFSSECIKIKADAIDPDGSVVQVQFFADTNLIGTVTTAPFNLGWQVNCPEWCNLIAVAIDDSGARTESLPVRIYGGSLAPIFPVVEMVQPRDRALFLAPATFIFSAELLASGCEVGPVEFFIDGHSVGTADPEPDPNAWLSGTTALHSVIVSNILEGEHKLTVRYYFPTFPCSCERLTNTIRVVKVGLQSARLTSERHFQIDVLTSLPNVETIFQASPNLQDWTPIETNHPPTNTFTFTESSPATNGHRFYRVVLPSQQP